MSFTLFPNLLVKWYRKNARDLPWRRTSDPYKIWISEIMLQQTTVHAVIPYFDKWLKIFPSVDDLARADIQKVLATWQGLGYYQRAKNLHKASQMIVRDHAGKVPDNPLDARKLPGFGPYTVGAVLSIAFDKRLPIIDANVRRVVMRLLAMEGRADIRHDKTILEFLDKVLPKKNVGDFNQALMELGALVCRSKEPLCILCPVRAMCQAYKEGKQEIIPTPVKRAIKDVYAVIGILKKGSYYFIQKRPSTGLLADLWEFPGGKIERKETPRAALARELKEELGIGLNSAKYLFEVKHFYTQFRVTLSVWQCEPKSYPAADKTHRWVDFDALHQYPMPSGSAKIVDKLIKLFRNPVVEEYIITP